MNCQIEILYNHWKFIWNIHRHSGCNFEVSFRINLYPITMDKKISSWLARIFVHPSVLSRNVFPTSNCCWKEMKLGNALPPRDSWETFSVGPLFLIVWLQGCGPFATAIGCPWDEISELMAANIRYDVRCLLRSLAVACGLLIGLPTFPRPRFFIPHTCFEAIHSRAFPQTVFLYCPTETTLAAVPQHLKEFALFLIGAHETTSSTGATHPPSRLEEEAWLSGCESGVGALWIQYLYLGIPELIEPRTGHVAKSRGSSETSSKVVIEDFCIRSCTIIDSRHSFICAFSFICEFSIDSR